MSGIQPAGLTDAELLHYCWLTGYDKLEPAWIEELAKRLEIKVGGGHANAGHRRTYTAA